MSVNAARLLEHETMSGKPDLTLHTLTHFLDRFVYRTPKASAAARGASIMQPLAGGETADRLVEAGKSAPQAVPLNSENFWKKKADDVAAEDVFFHEYFNRVNKDKIRAKKSKGADNPVDPEEADIDGLSDNEDEIWKALVDSRPDLEADEDSDEDVDLDDLDSAYDNEEDAGEDDEGGDDEVIFNDESDEPSDEEMDEAGFDGFDDEVASPPPAKKKAAKKPTKDEEPEEDEEAFDMDVSDDEAFLDSDEDLPSDMELGGVELPPSEAPSERKKRRKLKHLPTFASADDYAALLEDDDEGM